uniref:Glyco_18 domain-containing protein n=1 Tax=Globodera pallida TaxID=36090 RepID=A0A183BMK1_GLOPA
MSWRNEHFCCVGKTYHFCCVGKTYHFCCVGEMNIFAGPCPPLSSPDDDLTVHIGDRHVTVSAHWLMFVSQMVRGMLSADMKEKQQRTISLDGLGINMEQFTGGHFHRVLQASIFSESEKCARPSQVGRLLSAIVSVSSGRVVGYYQGNRALTSAQAKKLTHLILAFSVPDAQGNLSPLTSVQAQALTTGKSANSALKVLIAIGGGNGLDGADIDWQFPTVNDKANYVSFLRELNMALPSGALLSIAWAASAFYLDPGFDLAGIATAVDFINVMCYNFYGGWSTESTGPNSALYQGANADPSDSLNTNWTIVYHLTKMSDPEKLNLGVPFYGKYWNNVGAPLNGDDLWRQLGTYGTELPWRDLGNSFDLTKMTYHKTAKTPYIYDASSKIFLTFDNPQSLEDKVQYVASQKIGGTMIWAIDQDDDKLSLLNTVSK